MTGSNRYSFTARVVAGTLTMGTNEMTTLPSLAPVDAMELLLLGQTVRVDSSGPQRAKLMQMWERQRPEGTRGATE